MNEVVIQGLGELGRMLAGGAARSGRRVTPIVRGADVARVLATVPAASPVLVCVGEADLAAAIGALPTAVRSDVVLLQNDLFADGWRALGLEDPTVMVPWILKKKDLPTRIIQPTPVFGRHAGVVADVHAALGYESQVLTAPNELARELAAKYAFITTVNALGSLENRTMGAWWAAAPAAVRALTRDALEVAAARQGLPGAAAGWISSVDAQVERGMRVLADVPSAGRTARTRVDTTLAAAARFRVDVPAIAAVAAGRLP